VLAASRAIAPFEIEPDLAGRAELVVDPALPSDLGRADIVIASTFLPLGAGEFRQAERLAVITHLGSGVYVDVEAATSLGIPVMNNPGLHANSVAEHSMAMLLDVVKGVTRSDAFVRTGKPWNINDRELVRPELSGKLLGIVGFGEVGSRVARMARDGLGMQVITTSRTPGKITESGVTEVTLPSLLAQADVVSVHVSLGPDSYHLLDHAALSLMRPSAFLVNTSRAEVIDYAALADLLRAGRIAGAALDTWPHHRPDPDSFLLTVPNLVLTQQNGGLTHEGSQRMRAGGLGAVWDVLRGTFPTTSRLLNPAVWDHRRAPRQGLLIGPA
jgi:D-3-phosphoglycerate dehydrogenase / 2-oxoglutarate reductase